MTDGPGRITRGPLAYNVCLPYALDLACFQPATPEEATLRKSLRLGHEAVLVTLPSRSRAHHLTDSMGSTLPPLAFSAGAYVHGPMIGLRNNTTRYELAVLAVASIVRSLAPFHKFSSFTVLQNVASRLRRDRHNKPGSANLLFPRAVNCGFSLRRGTHGCPIIGVMSCPYFKMKFRSVSFSTPANYTAPSHGAGTG